jgi:hypothetical protein
MPLTIARHRRPAGQRFFAHRKRKRIRPDEKVPLDRPRARVDDSLHASRSENAAPVSSARRRTGRSEAFNSPGRPKDSTRRRTAPGERQVGRASRLTSPDLEPQNATPKTIAQRAPSKSRPRMINAKIRRSPKPTPVAPLTAIAQQTSKVHARPPVRRPRPLAHPLFTAPLRLPAGVLE